MSKSVIMNSFNNNFIFFLNDVLQLYPLNTDIKNSLKSIELISRVTPAIVIKVWYLNIYQPYKSFIDDGDISFFIDKNYSQDVSCISNANDILIIIDKIRGPISSMSSANRLHTMKHIQNLSKLSLLYNDC